MPTNLNTPVLCIGAIHRDAIAHANHRLERDTSTPAQISETLGGVAANTARVLARLGVDVHLGGLAGHDQAGRWLTTSLAAEGVRLITRPRGDLPTGSYIALHDPDGGLAAACVDDRILSEADEKAFDEIFDAIPEAVENNAIWFVDANCPPEILLAVARRAPTGRLAANAVSNAKAPRLKVIADKLRLLFLNRGEAAALLSKPFSTGLEDLAAGVQSLGVPEVVLTDGANGVFIATERERCHLPAPDLDNEIADVTGAGDALAGGTLAALSRGLALEKAVRAGQSAAQLTLQSSGAIADRLSWDKVAP